MPNYAGRCLTLFGTASIQNYIFSSNLLAENSGASEAVFQALEYWRNNAQATETIYVGGGNAAVIFANRDAALRSTRDWSLDLARDFPGLRVVAGHAIVGGRGLRVAYEEALRELYEAESGPPFGSPLGALPVVRTCPSTNLGASSRYEDPDGTVSWFSAEAAGKHSMADEAFNRFLGRVYREVLINSSLRPGFPRRLEELGVTEGASQIAVVHADGDGLGAVVRSIVDDGTLSDDEFAQALSRFSMRADELAWDAFRQTILDLVSTRDQWTTEEIQPTDDRSDFLIPLRAIVWGGDDLTFVTNGRLGLAVTARYLHNYSLKAREYLSEWLPLEQDTFTSSAGVAIVPLKFPFSRAYDIAEELAGQAKKRRAEQPERGSWLDFQIVMEGASDSLEGTRRALYPPHIMEGWGRPYRVDNGADGQPQGPWATLQEDWQRFAGTGQANGSPPWPRSRSKKLLEAIMQQGPALNAVEQANKARGYALPDRNIPFARYFDALELMDFYKPIDWTNRPQAPGGVR